MVKEIKFRVWDIQKEKFIPNDVYAILNRTDFNAFGIMIKDWENYCEGEYFYDNFQVLQRYSGVKDKNNVEIYEGDSTNFGKIVFFNGCFGMFSEDEYFKGFVNINEWNLDEIEVL